MAFLAGLVPVVTAGVSALPGIIAGIHQAGKTVKPATLISDLIDQLGLDAKYGHTTALKIARTILNVGKSIGWGYAGGASPAMIKAELTKQFGTGATGRGRGRGGAKRGPPKAIKLNNRPSAVVPAVGQVMAPVAGSTGGARKRGRPKAIKI